MFIYIFLELKWNLSTFKFNLEFDLNSGTKHILLPK